MFAVIALPIDKGFAPDWLEFIELYGWEGRSALDLIVTVLLQATNVCSLAGNRFICVGSIVLYCGPGSAVGIFIRQGEIRCYWLLVLTQDVRNDALYWIV